MPGTNKVRFINLSLSVHYKKSRDAYSKYKLQFHKMNNLNDQMIW
ncbi:hypothetical protein M23134_08210 [Microscilla marina ATCC 23134]|uniref:Uncharacterized protein n=1 Tax=Microscilla marina ATCC 23134 TaxID=313606 RepID=A1ZHB2_MICM2|nr:hypothetical protein M23134_08210 [Microscilla marina ATCC 23134]